MDKNLKGLITGPFFYILSIIIFFMLPKELRVNEYILGAYLLMYSACIYVIYSEKRKKPAEDDKSRKKLDTMLFLIPIVNTALLAYILPKHIAPIMYVAGFFLIINLMAMFYYQKARKVEGTK